LRKVHPEKSLHRLFNSHTNRILRPNAISLSIYALGKLVQIQHCPRNGKTKRISL